MKTIYMDFLAVKGTVQKKSKTLGGVVAAH